MIVTRATMPYAPRSPDSPPPALVERLSRRQCEVAILVADGVCDKGIAERLGLSPSTIPTYVKRIAKKLNLDPRWNLRIQITRVVVFAFAEMEDAA